MARGGMWLALVLLIACSDALALKSTSMLEIPADTKNSTVPCTLCAAAMPDFLDFCKLHNGYSVPELSHWLDQCGQLYERDFLEHDVKTGCSKETATLRSRARVLHRKVQCLKIYEGLAATYSPFDPCTQIRKLVDNAPMSVCQGPNVRCLPPTVDGDVPYIPAFALNNASLPYEFPPLRCPQYVNHLTVECHKAKQDFYARSNLEHTCSELFGTEQHQIAGCELVRQRMVDQDYTMDLCSSLAAKPITDKFEAYCEKTLRLPSNDFVPIVGYAAYLERVKLYKQIYCLSKPAADQSIFSTNGAEKVVSSATNETVATADPPVEIVKGL